MVYIYRTPAGCVFVMVVGVQGYLESLPEAVLNRLFQSPSTCLAIFRLLPPLAKSIVLFILFNNDPIPLDLLDKFVKPGHRRLQIEALQILRHMHIIKERYGAKTILVNAGFTQSLRCGLTSGDRNSSFGVPLEKNARVSEEFLREYATDKRESILHYMVGTEGGLISGKAKKPSDGVLHLLKNSGLMSGYNINSLSITSSGFQFLLQDENAQVWTLLLHYLNQSTTLGMDPVDVLNFIFMLGSLELGTQYTLSNLSQTQYTLLEDLNNLGIVYHTKKMGHAFWPTSLATMLTSEDSNDSSGSNKEKGFIIIETNYRLYAYTDNTLQISILNLFCNLKSRFVNLVVGRITRESIRRALTKGITAAQIIQYLSTHAHDQMRLSDSEHVLPPTVSDQIKLWQLEMDRFKATEGYLYREFPSLEEYNRVVRYAQDMGALIWKNDSKKIFFVGKESNSQVLDYIDLQMR